MAIYTPSDSDRQLGSVGGYPLAALRWKDFDRFRVHIGFRDCGIANGDLL